MLTKVDEEFDQILAEITGDTVHEAALSSLHERVLNAALRQSMWQMIPTKIEAKWQAAHLQSCALNRLPFFMT